MPTQRFLYCLPCNAVHHVTPFDTVPLILMDAGEIREIPRDDCQRFTAGHSGHMIQELISIEDRVEDRAGFLDPMKVKYI